MIRRFYIVMGFISLLFSCKKSINEIEDFKNYSLDFAIDLHSAFDINLEENELLLIKWPWSTVLTHYLIVVQDLDSVGFASVSTTDTTLQGSYTSLIYEDSNFVAFKNYKVRLADSEVRAIKDIADRAVSYDSIFCSDERPHRTTKFYIKNSYYFKVNISDNPDADYITLDSIVNKIILDKIRLNAVPWQDKIPG